MSFDISKRKLLLNAPLALGAVALASPSIVRAQSLMGVSTHEKVGAALERDLVPVTYYPVSLQKQFVENEKAMQGKPYADFFIPDVEVPAAWAKKLQHGPMPLEQTLTPSISDINKLLDPNITFPDAGYALLDGPCAYAQSRIEMPGVTTDMFKWWFTWHPQEKQRYMLWFPQAHIDNWCEDAKRLADTSLSYEKRLYNNTNHVTEYIGPNSLEILIHFTDPMDLGFDKRAFERAGFQANASGTISIGGGVAPDTTFMFMIHLARDTSRGLELFSRYWIGPHPEMKRFPGGENAQSVLNKLGMNKDTIEMLAYEMAVHDMTEFNQLARILPAVYQNFGQQG